MPKLGLVGYNTNTGLGELNRQLNKYLEVHSWMVCPHPKLPNNSLAENAFLIPMQNQSAIKQFVASVDVVLFCERPYYPELTSFCKRMNKRIVCIPMLEWTPRWGWDGWTKDVSLYLCPTNQCYNELESEFPCMLIEKCPWPVDTDRFLFTRREICRRFLFIGGHGGWKGRKGSHIVVQAKTIWPEMPLIVRSQADCIWPEKTVILQSVENNVELYAAGDVLICPHSVDGLGLEPMEAMASGMPVITTDGEPWNEIPSIAKICANKREQTVMRPVVWYAPSPESLVEQCKAVYNRDITRDSDSAFRWAMGRSWNFWSRAFSQAIYYGRSE